jgi:hypothetical protein
VRSIQSYVFVLGTTDYVWWRHMPATYDCGHVSGGSKGAPFCLVQSLVHKAEIRITIICQAGDLMAASSKNMLGYKQQFAERERRMWFAYLGLVLGDTTVRSTSISSVLSSFAGTLHHLYSHLVDCAAYLMDECCVCIVFTLMFSETVDSYNFADSFPP